MSTDPEPVHLTPNQCIHTHGCCEHQTTLITNETDTFTQHNLPQRSLHVTLFLYYHLKNTNVYSLLHNFQYFRDEEIFPENLFFKVLQMELMSLLCVSMGFTVVMALHCTGQTC